MSRIFGTDGVRGIANTELTSELAYNLGRAGAFVLTEGTHKPKILVAKDTRISGDMLEAALVAGILSVGAEAVMIGVVPTPAVAYLTREYNADAGVMISASHNPVEYNGIKFFDNRGYKLSDELEDKIQKTIEDGFVGVPSPIGKDLGKCHFEADGINKYMEHAKSTIATELTGLKVALDCANGAAYEVAVNAFKSLGAEVHVINNTPDGTNINENCGSTHPEALMEYVVREKCDVGFAFDGDAVLFSAESEKIFQKNGIQAFEEHEKANANTPMAKGPFANFLTKLSYVQQLFKEKDIQPIRTALVTSRNAPAHERAVKTLRNWGVSINEAFFLGGVSKTEILAAFGAHIFFDDQDIHTEPASTVVPAATVPYRDGYNPKE